MNAEDRQRVSDKVDDALWTAIEAGFTREQIEADVKYALDTAQEEGELA